MDPLELVRSTKSECQIWFNSNEVVICTPQEQTVEESKAISLSNIYMVDVYGLSQISLVDVDGYGWIA